MTSKTCRIINIVTAAVIVTAAILIFSWFNVRGTEFDFLKDLPNDCAATVIKTFWDGTSEEMDKQEFTLTQDQFSRILDLVQNTSYWRDPSSTIIHHEKTDYTIFITFESGSTAQYISINSSGGYAISFGHSMDTPFEQDFFRIRNKEWVAELEAILAS